MLTKGIKGGSQNDSAMAPKLFHLCSLCGISWVEGGKEGSKQGPSPIARDGVCGQVWGTAHQHRDGPSDRTAPVLTPAAKHQGRRRQVWGWAGFLLASEPEQSASAKSGALILLTSGLKVKERQ